MIKNYVLPLLVMILAWLAILFAFFAGQNKQVCSNYQEKYVVVKTVLDCKIKQEDGTYISVYEPKSRKVIP